MSVIFVDIIIDDGGSSVTLYIHDLLESETRQRDSPFEGTS